MTSWYCDSSALAKRYDEREPGSERLEALLAPDTAVIYTSALTRVEVASALSRKTREGHMSGASLNVVLARLSEHFLSQYMELPVTRAILDHATLLTRDHGLRAYDAVQLATALLAAEQHGAGDHPDLTFLASDRRLLAAAAAAGLPCEDPTAPR